MDTIKFGKHTVNLDFDDDGVAAFIKGGSGIARTAPYRDGAAGIAKVVREVVEAEAAYEQARVDRKRTIEDAKRLLGL